MSDDFNRCKKCNGSGLVCESMQIPFGPIFINFKCPKCKGKGYVEKRKARKGGKALKSMKGGEE